MHRTPASGRRSRWGAIALVGVIWATACEQVAQVTAPDAAGSPAAALQAAGRGTASLTTTCNPGGIAGLTAAGTVTSADRFRPVLGAAAALTSTSGVPMVDIGSPVAGAKTSAVDINDAGVVALNVPLTGGGNAAYTWTQAGGFVAIAPLAGATATFATDINNLGVVVGYATFADGSVRSWRSSSGLTTEITGGPANLQVRGINDAGKLTGSAGLGGAAQAVRYDGAAWQVLAAAPSSGWAINASGAVAGYVGPEATQRAYYWPAGSTAGQSLGVLPGTTSSRAYGLNDLGAVVGSSSTLSGLSGLVARAFYWTPGTGMVQIAGTGFSIPAVAYDVTNTGLVVGAASSDLGGTHAFAWTATAGPMADLGKDPASCSSYAFGINERCQIVGHNLMVDAAEGQHAARWDYLCPNSPPVPRIESVSSGTCSTPATVTFSFTDLNGAAGGPYSYRIDWGDGTSTTVTGVAAPGTFTGSHAYTSNGTFNVTVTVTDGASASATTSAVQITRDCNSPPQPVITARVAGTCSAASAVTFTFTDADGAVDSPWTYTIAWGDGTTTTKTVTTQGGSITEPHGYLANGTFTVTVTVTDRRGASTTVTTTLSRSCTARACTYTQGYWKNHEEAWPFPYSPTMPFMKTGPKSVTWDALFGTPPKGGNSFIQLAHQWMAATLSTANGAPMRADVKQALDAAGAWLYNNTGSDGSIPSIKSDQANGWAAILDDYNNGRLGTPHCS